VEFGVSAYNEGAGVVRTLESIRVAAHACGLPPAIRLSDSSDTPRTADAAIAWAAVRADVHFDLDYSDERRSLKAANNVLLDKATADIIVVSVGDAVVLPRSLFLLLSALTVEPRPVVAFGCSYPDPSARSLRFRASAWQIRVVQKLAASLPPDAPRADGVLWAAGRAFYADYRFPTGNGSLHDDEELKRYLVRKGLRIGNVAEAIAYKIPAGSFDDFARQTDRWFHVAEGTVRRDPRDLHAAATMALRDPLGAALYVFARVRLLVRRRRQPLAHSEQWDVTYTAKRDR